MDGYSLQHHLMLAAPAVVGFCALVWFLLKRLRARPTTVDLSTLDAVPEGVVSLGELARIWLRYNDVLIAHVIGEKPPAEETPSAAPETAGGAPARRREEERTPSDQGDGGDALSAVWRDLIEPHRELFEAQEAFELVEEAVRILREKGMVSSVPGGSEDPETVEVRSYRDVLASVPLVEHTINVLRNVMEELRKRYREPEVHIPRCAVAALWHDIGKIPEYLDSGAYGPRKHALVSANLLAAAAERIGKRPFWLDEVVQIVRDHHSPGGGEFKEILVSADRKARLVEAAVKLSDLKLLPFEKWFSLEELKTDLAQHVNVDQAGRRWVAFALDETIYVRPDGLKRLVDEQRTRKKVLSLDAIYEDLGDKIVERVASMMREEGWIQGEENERPVRRFRIVLRDGKAFSAFLIPVRASIYLPDHLREFELRRAATAFSNIAQVKPA